MKALFPFVVRVITALLAIVSNYSVSKILGIETFGVYSSMLTITFTLGLFTDWGLSIYGSQLLATSDNKTQFINQSLQLKVWLCIAFSFIYLLFCFFNANHSLLLFIGLPIVLFNFLNPEWIARGLMKPDIASLRQLAFSIINFLGFLIIYYCNLPKAAVFILYTLNAVLSCWIIYRYIKKHFSFHITLKTFPISVFAKTSVYFLGYLLNNLIYTSGAIMLTLLGQPKTMGIYASYYNIFATIVAPVSIAYGLFSPKIKEIEHTKFYSNYINIIYFVALVGIIFYSYGDFFYHVFYPKNFAYDKLLNTLTLVMFLLYCLENIFVVNSILEQKPRKYFYKNIIGLLMILIGWSILFFSQNITANNIFITIIIAQGSMILIGFIQHYKVLKNTTLKNNFWILLLLSCVCLNAYFSITITTIVISITISFIAIYKIFSIIRHLY